MNDFDPVLVERLRDHCSTFNYSLEQVFTAEPISKYVNDGMDREDGYDLGRVRYFVDELLLGRSLDPIVLDTHWHGMSPTGPVLIDGYHRLTAAILTQQTHINASFSGPVDLLAWLTGSMDEYPL